MRIAAVFVDQIEVFFQTFCPALLACLEIIGLQITVGLALFMSLYGVLMRVSKAQWWVGSKAVFTFGARALVPEHRKK